MLKLKKAWVVVALSMLSLLVLSFGALAADEPSAQTAGTVTVGEGEDAAEYDLNAVRGDEDAGVLGAIDYTGSYADNLQSDENFEENVDTRADKHGAAAYRSGRLRCCPSLRG